MTKRLTNQFSVRLDDVSTDQLRNVAKAERRAPCELVRLVLTDWLTAHSSKIPNKQEGQHVSA